MKNWSEQQCQQYSKGQGILSTTELTQHLQSLDDWKIVTNDNQAAIRKSFKFKRYSDVLAFVAKTGSIAEAQDHHPDMLVKWGECIVSFTTHSAGGITLNEIICAHLVDEIF